MVSGHQLRYEEVDFSRQPALRAQRLGWSEN